ncbi:MAG TPA: hypothetical protein VE398_02760, partial [Acidobacteriota bacterium]|nr:hypothetical protein [Acidobacteriota bacterium]
HHQKIIQIQESAHLDVTVKCAAAVRVTPPWDKPRYHDALQPKGNLRVFAAGSYEQTVQTKTTSGHSWQLMADLMYETRDLF